MAIFKTREEAEAFSKEDPCCQVKIIVRVRLTQSDWIYASPFSSTFFWIPVR